MGDIFKKRTLNWEKWCPVFGGHNRHPIQPAKLPLATKNYKMLLRVTLPKNPFQFKRVFEQNFQPNFA